MRNLQLSRKAFLKFFPSYMLIIDFPRSYVLFIRMFLFSSTDIRSRIRDNNAEHRPAHAKPQT